MTKNTTKMKKTKTLTCKTCSETFEVVHGNAKYCSPECRTASSKSASGTPSKSKLSSKKAWEEHKKAEKEREKQWLRENLPLYEGKLLNKDGSVMKGRVLERYLVDWVW